MAYKPFGADETGAMPPRVEARINAMIYAAIAAQGGTAVAPTITTAALNAFTVGTQFNQQLLATGTIPVTWTIATGALPAGVVLNASTGVIAGIPTAANSYSVTFRATNAAGEITKQFTGTVAAAPVGTAPVISTTSLNTIQQNVAFSQTLARSGTAPITFSVSSGALPAGITLNTSTGVISGTATTLGAYNFTVTATNTTGSASRTYSGTVTAASAGVAPTITTAGLESIFQAVAFSQAITVTGTTPITFDVSAGALPAGLALSTGGTLSGTATGFGAYDFTIRATNGTGANTRQYTGTVIEYAGTPPNITTTSLPTLNQGVLITQALNVTGTAPISWLLTAGVLPAGLELGANGVLAGTPTSTGAYDFTVTATNGAGSDTQQYTGSIVPAPVPITPGTRVTSDSLNRVDGAVNGTLTDAADGGEPARYSGTGTGTFLIYSNLLGGTGGSASSMVPALGADVQISATVAVMPSSASGTWAMALRAQTDAYNGTHYTARFYSNGSISIGRSVAPNGSFTSFWTSEVGQFVIGDRLTFRAVGDQLSVLKADVVLQTVTDNSIPSGAFGGFTKSSSVTGAWEDWDLDAL